MDKGEFGGHAKNVFERRLTCIPLHRVEAGRAIGIGERGFQQGDRIRRKPIADSGQQGLQIEVSLRTDEAFQLLARRPIDTAVAAPQENMLEHGIDRLPARTKIVGNPPRQRPAIRLRHTAEPEMPQNLRAMPTGSATGEIIVIHGVSFEAQLLGQIQNTIGGERRMILHEEAVRLAKADPALVQQAQ